MPLLCISVPILPRPQTPSREEFSSPPRLHGDHKATMKFAILGLLVVLVIAFFVVVWKAAKDWRWFNIVAVCFTMLLAIAFLFPTAGVLKSRSAWHKIKEELEVKAVEVEIENRLIKYGDPANPEAGEGVVVLDQKLSKLGIEAGRRWRNLQMQNVANNNITLQGTAQPQVEGLPEEPPVAAAADDAAAADAAGAAAAPAAPAAPAVLVPESLVVYGFAETPNEQQILIPTFYLGEFRVTASTPDQVTLTPTGPLEPGQLQAISNRQARSWTLYELLPLDGHQPFVAEGSVSSDDNFFGRIDDALVQKLLGNRVRPETLQSYLRDGSRATQDDPPISRWTKIEFIKNHAIEVDSPEQRGALDGGFFDGNGRAVDSRLQRGDDGQVNFKKEDQILVKEEAANQLISEGAARLVFRYYLRPLNDYRFVLRRIRLRLTELANRMSELEFEKNVLEGAIEKTNGMLVVNQAIKLKLEQDLAQFQVEKTAIADYASKTREGVKKMRTEMIRLHRENLALEQKLEDMHFATQRRLDALTAGQ